MDSWISATKHTTHYKRVQKETENTAIKWCNTISRVSLSFCAFVPTSPALSWIPKHTQPRNKPNQRSTHLLVWLHRPGASLRVSLLHRHAQQSPHLGRKVPWKPPTPATTKKKHKQPCTTSKDEGGSRKTARTTYPTNFARHKNDTTTHHAEKKMAKQDGEQKMRVID